MTIVSIFNKCTDFIRRLPHLCLWRGYSRYTPLRIVLFHHKVFIQNWLALSDKIVTMWPVLLCFCCQQPQIGLSIVILLRSMWAMWFSLPLPLTYTYNMTWKSSCFAITTNMLYAMCSMYSTWTTYSFLKNDWCDCLLVWFVFNKKRHKGQLLNIGQTMQLSSKSIFVWLSSHSSTTVNSLCIKQKLSDIRAGLILKLLELQYSTSDNVFQNPRNPVFSDTVVHLKSLIPCECIPVESICVYLVGFYCVWPWMQTQCCLSAQVTP